MKSIFSIAFVALISGCGADHFASDTLDAGGGDASAAGDAALCDFKWVPKNPNDKVCSSGQGPPCGFILVRRTCCSVVAIGVATDRQKGLQQAADAATAGCGCTPSLCSAGVTLVDEFSKTATCSPMPPVGCLQAQCDNGSCGAHVN